MPKKPTIYDIAKKLNLSGATVSRALNGNPRISEATRKKVLETALSLNYQQNNLARALQSGKSFSVGVIVPTININFLSTVIKGIEEELNKSGYHVIICQSQEDELKEIENINTLLNAQVDGILLSSCNFSKENLKQTLNVVLSKNIPVVFFDRMMEVEGTSSVSLDDKLGGYLATKELIKQGAKRIAHFAGNRAMELYNDRYKGYLQALEESNIAFNKEYVIQVASKTEDGKAAIKKLLALENPPDALFSSSDFAALGAIQQLKEFKINVPNDFCVFGFGNEPFTQFNELSISSIDQSPEVMGIKTAQVFLDKMLKKTADDKKIILKPTLKLRDSSKKK